MSTKTTIKRVALVAAFAAAFAGLSTVAANATAPTLTGTGSAAGANTTVSAVTSTYVSESITAGSSDSYYTITTSGVGSVLYPSSNSGNTLTAASATSEIWSQGSGAVGTGSGASWAGNNVLTFSVYSATAGTQTITVTGSSSAAQTMTITWAAAPLFAAANSTAYLQSLTHENASATPSSDDTVAVAKGSAGSLNDAGDIVVTVKNNASSPVAYNGTTVSASISGSGLILTNNSQTEAAGTARSSSVTLTGANVAYVHITSDGTSGTGTITVSVTDPATAVTTVLATKTVTFYSTTVASIAVTANTPYLPAASVSNFAPTATEGLTTHATSSSTSVAPVAIVAKDSNGNAIPGTDDGSTTSSLFTVKSSATSVATVGSVYYDSTNGYFYPMITPVSEGTTTITVADASTGLITATVAIWVTKAVAATVTATTDASTYAAGSAGSYTVSALDAAGNPIADGTYTGFFTTAPTSNVAIQGALPNTTSTKFSAGKASTTFYAPVAAGNLLLAGGTLNAAGAFIATAAQGTSVNSVTVAVTSSTSDAASAATDAANEATDAANAATDAANAAADAADAATQAAQDASAQAQAALAAVNALSAKITVLAAQIAKIVKKLGA